MLVREPIDVIVVLDNSGSMDEELDSVERNVNESFARNPRPEQGRLPHDFDFAPP